MNSDVNGDCFSLAVTYSGDDVYGSDDMEDLVMMTELTSMAVDIPGGGGDDVVMCDAAAKVR